MLQQLPLFPLQLVIFPREELKLHIFEARYRQLILDCATDATEFGIPAYIDGELMPIFTGVRLLRIDKRYSSGESDVTVMGTRLFQMDEYFAQLPDKLYAGGTVSPLPLIGQEDKPTNEVIKVLAEELFQLLNVSTDVLETEGSFETYDIAHQIGFTLDQEYEFLCQTEAQQRQNMLLRYLEELLPTVRRMEALRLKAMMNGAHQNIIPPTL